MSHFLFKPHFRVQECLSEIEDCLSKGWTGLGFKTLEFETEWKTYTNLTNAHFLNSNTSGLHLALEIYKHKYDWKSDSEVITTPLTFVATNHMILHSGLKPVFADIDQYLCLDPDDILRKITPKTKAIIFVGLGGNTGQLKQVIQICQKYDIKLILDAAHMAGTRLDNVHIGQDCDCSIFSFQAVKNLPTADSGMICFKDSIDDRNVRKFSWLGINKDTYERTQKMGLYRWDYDVESLGFKYHGNSIMASLGLVGLKYLDTDNAFRRKLAKIYANELGENKKVEIIKTHDDCISSQHLFQIKVEDRDSFINELYSHEIFCGVHYKDNTLYPMYTYGYGTCPNAHEASQKLVSLPLHLSLCEADVKFIAETINKVTSA